MSNLVKLVDAYGVEFWATKAQQSALATIQKAGNGRFISVLGYTPTTGYVKDKCPTKDYTLLSNISVKRLYERKIEALEAITFDMVKGKAKENEKLAEKSDSELEEIFNARKAMELKSLKKSLDGTLDNAHTQAHERNYANFGKGTVVKFVTEKVDGKQIPVLTDGLPTAQDVIITGTVIQDKVIVEGERKKVNSREPVLMSNVIKSFLNNRSVGLQRWSLKPDRFKEVRLDSGIVLSDDLKELIEG